MMDRELREAGRTAIRRLDRVCRTGPGVSHEDVQQAVTCVAAFRNRAIALHRDGRVDRQCRDVASALLSLAYGVEFPLSSFHAKRFKQTRDVLQALIDGNAG